jgi:HPt (histidine-containing phosphotransfer) domain-containing protein
MTGGTEAGYRKVLAQFCRDAAERLPVLAAFPGETGDGTNGRFSGGKPDRQDSKPAPGRNLADLTTQVHALKSAAGTIGAAELSEEAAALETAGKAGDRAAARTALPAFREHLARLIEGIGKALETEAKAPSIPQASPSPSLHPPLAALRQALDAKNMKEIDRLLEELEALPLDKDNRDAINTVSDKILMGEYEAALAEITRLEQASGAEQKEHRTDN